MGSGVGEDSGVDDVKNLVTNLEDSKRLQEAGIVADRKKGEETVERDNHKNPPAVIYLVSPFCFSYARNEPIPNIAITREIACPASIAGIVLSGYRN